MAVILAICEIAPEHEDEWQQIWRQTQRQQELQPGFRAARWFRDVTQPGRYVFQSEWDDRADHDAMVRSLGLLWLDRALEFLAHPVTILVLEEMEMDQEPILTETRAQAERQERRRMDK
jgi:quinol monooxygenase YgiN